LPIDPVVLARMIAGSAKDLASITSQLAQINSTIVVWGEDDALYKGILELDKSNLETALEAKRIALGGDALTYGPNFPTGATYDVSWLTKDITDWEITLLGAIIYKYIPDTGLQTSWSEAFSINDTGMSTWRNLIVPTADLATIRIGIRAHNTYISTLVNASIGLRDPATQDIVAGTMSYFTFDSGETRHDVQPGETSYSDWLAYPVITGTEYFVTLYFEGYMAKVAGLTDTWFRNGNYSEDLAWGVLGTPASGARGITALEGFASGSGTGWDGDATILQQMVDWNIAVPLIYSKPFGTKAMLKALNKGQPLISTRKTHIQNRNPILSHYI